jgi:hypothetical protein
MATGTKAVIAGVSVAAATGVTLGLTQSEAPKPPISH